LLIVSIEIIKLGQDTLTKKSQNFGSNCHGQMSSTTMDSEDKKMTRRKVDMNKKSIDLLPRDLEYKVPKTGVKPEWFITDDRLGIYTCGGLMHARHESIMHACYMVPPTTITSCFDNVKMPSLIILSKIINNILIK
jgi:hypothetical protein